MLENVKNGDIIVCRGGYTFTWDNHYIYCGAIYNYEQPECYIEDVIEIKK